MKGFLPLIIAVLLICSAAEAQKALPKGASDFFLELGGLMTRNGKPDIVQRIAGNRIDKVEGGGGLVDWTEVEGRVFARAAWMIEIREMASEYSSYDLEKSLAGEMQKQLTSKGFRITPAKPALNYFRYQKGSIVGALEVRSFFLNKGNLPLHYEFIFTESYRPTTKSRVIRNSRG
jgi:hypothetical protein